MTTPRVVGLTDFHNFTFEVRRFDASMDQAFADAGEIEAQLQAITQAGRDEELQSVPSTVPILIHMLTAGARLECAAVRFMGERRSKTESLGEYIDRLIRAVSSPCAMRALQRRNGIRFHEPRKTARRQPGNRPTTSRLKAETKAEL